MERLMAFKQTDNGAPNGPFVFLGLVTIRGF